MAIKQNPPLLGSDIIERAKKLSSSLVADGMKGLGVELDGCMEPAIMPIEPFMSVVGTALTVETDNGDNFPIHVATYTGGEGYVMVIDGKGKPDAAYFGELIASAAKAVGFSGVVCDGYVRDRDGLTGLAMPVYAKGFTQRGPKKQDPGAVNEPIRCGGVAVNPGDLIVADCDGVTVVPRDLIPQALANAEEKLAYEQKRQQSIAAYSAAKAAGKLLPQLAPQWVLDML